MKKIIFIAILMAVATACTTKEKKAETTEVVVEKTEATIERAFSGEFISVADGAVLKVENAMYAVEINALSEELATKVAPVKKDDFDMVPVTVKGILKANPLFKETGEGWRQMLSITEIVEVGTTPAEADIKIGKEKE